MHYIDLQTYSFINCNYQTIIYRPTIRCLLYDRITHCYWFVSKNFNQSECIYFKYSIQIYIAFIQNGTGSWGLPFLYSYTYIHRNMTGSWGLPSFHISTSTHRIRKGSWGLPSFYIHSSIITNIQMFQVLHILDETQLVAFFLSPLLSLSFYSLPL